MAILLNTSLCTRKEIEDVKNYIQYRQSLATNLSNKCKVVIMGKTIVLIGGKNNIINDIIHYIIMEDMSFTITINT